MELTRIISAEEGVYRITDSVERWRFLLRGLRRDPMGNKT